MFDPCVAVRFDMPKSHSNAVEWGEYNDNGCGAIMQTANRKRLKGIFRWLLLSLKFK